MNKVLLYSMLILLRFVLHTTRQVKKTSLSGQCCSCMYYTVEKGSALHYPYTGNSNT